MASAVLLRKLLAAPSVPGAPAVAYALRPVSTVAGARRFFNSGGTPLGRFEERDEEEEEMSSGIEDDVAVDDRRRARDTFYGGPVFFSTADLVGPFGAPTPTTLGRLLSKLEAEAEAEASSSAARAGGGGTITTAPPRRGWWVAKNDADAVVLKVPMPGLGKEHVKVWADQNALVVTGEGDKELEEGIGGRDGSVVGYNRRIDLPADGFKMDQVRAEMKNGLLKVTVPRVKAEERTDVFRVTVE